MSAWSRSDIVAQKFLPFVANYASLAPVDWCPLHPWLSALEFALPRIGMMGLGSMRSRFIQLISYICRQVIPHPPPLGCRVQFGSIRPSVKMIGCCFCASAIVDTDCGTVDLHSTHAAALELGVSDVAFFVWSIAFEFHLLLMGFFEEEGCRQTSHGNELRRLRRSRSLLLANNRAILSSPLGRAFWESWQFHRSAVILV